MDFLTIIRRRVEAGKPNECSIPNCDVKLLLEEISRLKRFEPSKDGRNRHYDDDTY